MDSKKKVLIVEDSPELLMALSDAVAKAGYLVRKASSGDEGYQLAMSTKPDLIVTDKMMPKSSGITMMFQIRQIPEWGKDVPVLFFTNVNTATDEERAMLEDIKPISYLNKSTLSLAEFVQKIKEVFGGKQST